MTEKKAAEPTFSKRKRWAKNKKKSWRGIDIKETEEFLEDQRFQQRTTGLVAEKADDQLFTVERTAPALPTENAAPRSKRKAKTELKCYSNLINTSKINCPRSEYPVAADYEGRVVKREVNSVRASKRQPASQKSEPDNAQTSAVTDLWGGEEKEPEGDDHFLQVTKRRRVQAPKHVKRKVSARPAVEVPHPGASVNPTYDDHQDLLLEAHMAEEKVQRAQRKIYNATDAKFPSAADAPTQADWIEEMSGGLFEKEGGKEELGDPDKHISINPPVNREKKKTPSERKKQKAAKLLLHKMSQEKEVKGRENKVFSIPTIKSQLAQERREMKKRMSERVKKLEAKKFLPKKLGKTKVETPELSLKLSSELVGNLRSVKPEGHLLEERYKSMQMRNIVEPRGKQNKKKTKKKNFEKKSFREITA